MGHRSYFPLVDIHLLLLLLSSGLSQLWEEHRHNLKERFIISWFQGNLIKFKLQRPIDVFQSYQLVLYLTAACVPIYPAHPFLLTCNKFCYKSDNFWRKVDFYQISRRESRSLGAEDFQVCPSHSSWSLLSLEVGLDFFQGPGNHSGPPSSVDSCSVQEVPGPPAGKASSLVDPPSPPLMSLARPFH